MVTGSKIREAQKMLNDALAELKSEAVSLVEKENPMEGVKVISRNCVSISMKNIFNNNWAPSTYVPESQVEAVKKVLSPISSFDAFEKKLTEIMRTKSVKIGRVTTSLNPATMKALTKVMDAINS